MDPRAERHGITTRVASGLDATSREIAPRRGARPPGLLRASAGSRRQPDGELRRPGSGCLHGALDEDPGGRDRRGEDRRARPPRHGQRRELGARWRARRRLLDRPAVLGQGIATAALAAFLEELDTRPLYAHVATHNVGSIRVLEKCGFERTGDGSTPSVDDSGAEELVLK